jgi:PilZ domain
MPQTVAASENRKFHRIFYSSNAELSSPSGRHACHIVDISLKGCLLDVPEFIAVADPHAEYRLRLTLAQDVVIHMDLSVTHVEHHRVGFVCRHIDLDSISALRRLVELNLGDSGLLERELNALSHYADHEEH